MRLSPSIKRAIVNQFKTGDSMQYLATVYEVSPSKIEFVIRAAMIKQDSFLAAREASARQPTVENQTPPLLARELT
jgi:hypothetical protein